VNLKKLLQAMWLKTESLLPGFLDQRCPLKERIVV
jgi:hypothetical protein